jgi:two-component system cell cycle response regulator
MRILIADDDPICCCMLSTLLSKEGHEVTVAKDGVESWNILQAQDAPDLAILDWQMPGLDGLEVCRRLRQLEQKPYVFVILLTANNQRNDLLEGLQAGVDDYMTKPLDPALLRARLEVGRRILDLQANLMAAQEKLRFQADHDSLTGLYNRSAVLRHLRRELSRAQRDRAPLGVVIGDLDHFKHINDTYGHPAGDRVLCEAAHRIASSVRVYDTVGRVGGEEFLIILPGCDASSTLAKAERIRENVGRELVDLGGRQARISISLGVVSADPFETVDEAELVARADVALYQAKESGRNRVQLSNGVIHAYAT